MIHNCALTWELLQEYPVWTESEVNSEYLVPLDSADPFQTDYDSLTLKADFITPFGRKLQGCVVFSSTFERVYLIEIFVAGEGITFNRNLAGLVSQQLERLNNCLGGSDDPIFPLGFSTDLKRNGVPFDGTFDPMNAD